MTDETTSDSQSGPQSGGVSDDPVSILSRVRPDLVRLEAEWDVTQRAATLAGILDSEPGRPQQHHPRWVSRHRWSVVVAGAIAACALVATGLVLPAGSAGGPNAAAAATLDQLAVTAGTSGREIGPGQYAYTIARQVQTFSADDIAHGSHATTDRTIRTWTALGGDAWQLQNQCLRYLPYDNLTTPAGGTYGGLNSSALAMLPTDPDGLASYLDKHPSGDNRATRNRFNSVGDLVESGLATPKLRSAAIRVLARTRGVTVHPRSHDALGRNAIQVDYTAGKATQSLFFSAPTSDLMEYQIRENGKIDYRSTVQRSGIVSALPNRPSCR